MGFFDFFKPAKAAANPEKLRETLFAAIQANDWPRLAKLCETHHGEIVRAFPGWKILPQDVLGDPAAAQRFGQCLGALADFFARVRGEPELVQQLIGPEESNPIVQWDKKLQQALALMGEVRYQEVIPLMADLLTEFQGYGGDALGDYLAKANGHLGCSYFHTGSAAKAVEPLGQALALCRQRGDVQGHGIYLSNLFEVHRYLGQPGPAADYAGQLADLRASQGNTSEAAWYQRQSAIVRAGEPLVRLIASVNDQRYELDEVTLQPGVFVGFDFYRSRLTLAPSLRCQMQAKETWAQGQAKETLTSLLAAAQADPFDPDPFYQMGTVVLYSRMYEQAVGCFQKAESLAPGWFYCRRYLWLARQLAQGNLEQDTFLALQALDDNGQSRTPGERVSLARDALARTPRVAWLHLCLGSNLKELKQLQEAEVAFRTGLDCADDPDVKSCLSLELAVLQEKSSAGRAQYLEEVLRLNGNLTASASARLFQRL